MAQTKIEKAKDVYLWFIESSVMNFGDIRYESFLSNIMNPAKRLKYDLYRIKLDGSFVTGRKKPEDVDFAVLIRPEKVREAFSLAKNQHDINAIAYF